MNMIRKHLFAATLAISTAFAAPIGYAQGVPTIDTQNITQQIQQVRHMLEDLGIQTEQLDALTAQIDKLEEQYGKLQELHAALTGRTDILGMLLGDQSDCIINGRVTNVLGMLRQGVNAGNWGSLFSEHSCAQGSGETVERVLTDAGLPQERVSEMAASGNPGQARVAEQAATGALVAAVAENSHSEAGQSLARVDRLVSEIPNMGSLKESVDHNTRVTAELAIAMTKMWELEAIQTIGDGMSGVAAAAMIAEEQQFMDFTIPTGN